MTDAISVALVLAAVIAIVGLAEHLHRTRFRVLTRFEGERVTLGLVDVFGRLRLDYEVDAIIRALETEGGDSWLEVDILDARPYESVEDLLQKFTKHGIPLRDVMWVERWLDHKRYEW